MTQIRQKAFSHRIEEYLHNSESFDKQKFDSSLYQIVNQNRNLIAAVSPSSRAVKVIRGLCFSEHIELVMILIDRAYRGLVNQTGTRAFALAIAKALQTYAEPLTDGDYACFPYPYFLLHGLGKTTTEAVVWQIEENSRGCYLARASEQQPHGTDCSYIAKASFFLDTSKKEITVITIQGQRIQQGNKARSREFARLGHRLQMDPRAYVLKNICEIGRQDAYQKIRVIKPRKHPMFVDNHCGFKARYDPIIRQAGITTESGCYLESDLSAPTEQ
jgi:hypothetical protein